MVSPERPLNWVSNLCLIDMFNHSAPHRQHIIDRYWELRQTWLNTDNLVARFQNAVDELENCGAAAREEARWSKDSDIGGKTLDISAEMEKVEQWIRRRMVYLDNNVFVRTAALLGDVDDNGVVDIADVTSLIDFTLNGSPVNELNSDVDQDGEITIADIVLLIDIVLSK